MPTPEGRPPHPEAGSAREVAPEQQPRPARYAEEPLLTPEQLAELTKLHRVARGHLDTFGARNQELNATLGPDGNPVDQAAYRRAIKASLHAKETLEQAFATLKQREAALPLLKLREQYEQKTATLEQVGLLERRGTDLGIQAIDGSWQVQPSLAQVQERFRQRTPELTPKIEQEFSEALVVPQGLPLARFVEVYGARLRYWKAQGTLRSPDGTTLELDETTPVWVADEYHAGGKQANPIDADVAGRLRYDPTTYAKDQSGGVTKRTLIEQGEAFRTYLLPKNRIIPRAGQGRTVAERPALEAGQTAQSYQARFARANTTDPYRLESGLNPEAWLTLATLHLEATKGEVIDDYNAGSACLLTASFLNDIGALPRAGWGRGGRRAGLGWGVPGNASPRAGVRPAVRV